MTLSPKLIASVPIQEIGTRRFVTRLQNYFRSGWAFLIPYLAAYLIYAWLNLPVNPSDEATTATFQSPSLLSVYRSLHVIHIGLAAIALTTWWRSKSIERTTSGPSVGESFSLSILQRSAPWLCLALLFYIPGIYLEWPSDTWEHLRRINEWHAHNLVAEHSAWKKSSYFLPYSFTRHTTGLSQLGWLNLYYTVVCLLLNWQYYRLARAIGLSSRASFVFVLLTTLTFGNSIFSFYRYYGLSSSINAQLGAVAMTRIVLEAAKNPQLSVRFFFRWPPLISEPKNTHRPLATNLPPTVFHPLLSTLGQPLGALLSLAVFIALNHVQGLGIAGIGMVAIVFWRLVEWKRAMIGWIGLAAILLSITAILWFPRHPALHEFYDPQHWFTAWYGFNLFFPESPAFERALHILGTFGICNLAAGIVLATRNHPAGWLTLIAPFILVVPFTAIPFANSLIKQDTILTFHRMLLAIPSGLAAVCLLSNSARFFASAHMLIVTIATFGLVVIQTTYPTNNRLWHLLSPPPLDLTYRSTFESYNPIDLPAKEANLVCTEATAFILETIYQAPTKEAGRTMGAIPIKSIVQVLGAPALVQSLNIHEIPLPVESDWLTVSGALPVFETTEEFTPTRSAVVQNENGQATEVVTKKFFPVDRNRSYQVEMSIRTDTGNAGTAYLAIVWYDNNGVLLDAATPTPEGAGDPSGWRNGTYSYFGLVGEVPPFQWHTYRVSFGSRENRAIPANAKYARMGVLLNANASPNVSIQLSRARLWEKSEASPISDGTFAENNPFFVFTGNRMNTYSPGSQSGLLSGHWPVQQVASENGGEPELGTALGRPLDAQKKEGNLYRLSP